MTLKFWLLLALALVLLTALCVAGVDLYHHWQPWISMHTGSNNVSGGTYGYWSGFGSVFPWSMDTAVALWIIIWHHVKRMNCHTERCWRIGTLPVGQYKVCKKCHKEATGSTVTMEHLKLHHHLANRKRLLDAGFTVQD